VDSPHDVLDIPTGDGQMDLEAQLVQEVILARRLWLNLHVRAGVQRAGERERRLSSPTAFIASRATLTRLHWDPGDYVAIDFAPLYRFNERFAAGFTAGVFERARDRSRFLTPQDSIDLATRLGGPVAATLADQGTAYRRIRLGATLTYVGPAIEAGVSAERTVSARGGDGIPDATVFRIVLRLTRKLL
jgi:hypothetical protein